MGLFTDKEKMFIPLSVDNVDTDRSSYFLSNKKMIVMALAILPYIGILATLLNVGAGLIPVLVVTIMYLVLFVYLVRFWVFEETRLKKMLKEKDENVISGANHFWLIDKVGSGKRDDGLIYYQRDGSSLKRGLVVYFDRGSDVGVPEGHYEQFRKTKMEFMREIYARGMSLQWYDMPKRTKSKMPPSLVRYSELMLNEPNMELSMLVKLQININLLYSKEAENRYVDYIVITNKRFTNMKRFKGLVEDIIATTLRSNGYLKDVHILGKEEVDEFLQSVYMQDTLNSSYIRKSVAMKPFNQYAKLKRIIDIEGRAVPIEVLDDITLTGGGESLDEIIEKDIKREDALEAVRKQRLANDLKAARKARLKDEITENEYKAVLDELEKKYDPAVYDPDAERKQKEEARKREQEQREAEKRAKRERREEKQPDKDWFNSDKPVEAKKISDTDDFDDIFKEYEGGESLTGDDELLK